MPLNQELNNCARNTNDASRLRQLVAQGADLASTNGGDWRHTPLHQACFHNRPLMVKALLELGAYEKCARSPRLIAHDSRVSLTKRAYVGQTDGRAAQADSGRAWRGLMPWSGRCAHLHSNPCGRGRTGTPVELARGGGHNEVVKILEGYVQRPHAVGSVSVKAVALVVHGARYGWAGDIWNVAPGSGTNHGGGAKDVTDVVRHMITNDELHINPNSEGQYMNRTFWPETSRGPAIPRKLAVRYSYGDSPILIAETHETVSLHVTSVAAKAAMSAMPVLTVDGLPVLPVKEHTAAGTIGIGGGEWDVWRTVGEWDGGGDDQPEGAKSQKP